MKPEDEETEENTQEEGVQERWFGPLIDADPEELAKAVVTPERNREEGSDRLC